MASAQFRLQPMEAKRPALANWKLYQERLPTPDELLTWFASAEGVGVICGKVSGNLEMLELEGRAVADKIHLDLKRWQIMQVLAMYGIASTMVMLR
jgi:hypothetical protein